MRLHAIVFGTLALGLGGWSAAQDAPPKPPPQKPCSAPENRQFDFWLGEWNVTNAQGARAGSNRITAEEQGCVLHEHWSGAKGGTGQSFNLYDATDGKWHQIWVDSQGGLLQLSGGIVDGKMVLEGPGRGSKSEPVINRIVWTKLDGGRVRQTWTVSSDDGKTWTTSFDGIYAK
ncbi:MAG TPA: hypothetical protein VFV19_05745 [Candidatus Polarisedimenticolaceae bacterium]|nr:hypothetical protein [Candidatus Polarisedimenticolaceae bacterium]